MHTMTPEKTTEPAAERKAKGVRLDLSPADHVRLEQCARELGLTRASYARMAVLKRLKADEERRAGTHA
jgi:hypothetical protein